MDSKDEKVKKRLERAAKRKAKPNNLYFFIRVPAAGSATPSLFCFGILTLLLSCLGLTLAVAFAASLSSRPRSPTLLLFWLMSALSSHSMPTSLSCSMPALSTFDYTLAARLPLLVPVSRPKTLSILSSLPMLGLALTHLTSLVLKTFQQTLSDEFLRHYSTSSAELLYLFPILDSLLEKSKRKQPFDTTFIISRPLGTNHATKEINLRFGECRCSALVKLNRLQQFKLLDRKLVCIIGAILLAAALLWEILFASCLCHTMKLVSKLGLRMWSIACKVVKERIMLIQANKTIRQLDELFQNNPEQWTGTAIIYVQSNAKPGRKSKKKKKNILSFMLVLVVFLDDTPGVIQFFFQMISSLYLVQFLQFT